MLLGLRRAMRLLMLPPLVAALATAAAPAAAALTALAPVPGVPSGPRNVPVLAAMSLAILRLLRRRGLDRGPPRQLFVDLAHDVERMLEFVVAKVVVGRPGVRERRAPGSCSESPGAGPSMWRCGGCARGGIGRTWLGIAPRCRITSKSAMPAATETFSDVTWPKSGIDTSSSQCSRTSRRMPRSSPPRTSATGRL
jgi:hypothetical protein